jgi:hypothetical protein
MRYDPRRRLTRPLPGDAAGNAIMVAPEGASVDTGRLLRLHYGGERELPQEPVPARDQAELFSVTPRPTTRLATAGPNAPQLMRLIRHPYRHEPGRFGRTRIHEERAGSGANSSARPSVGHPMREAGNERGEMTTGSPDFGRPRPFAVRPSAPSPLPALPGGSGARR